MESKALPLLLLLACVIALPNCYNTRSSNGGGQTQRTARDIDTADLVLAPGFRAEVVTTGLTFPSDLTFDEQGQIYVVETGYSYGERFLAPRLLRLAPDGRHTTIATGEKNGPWTAVDYQNGQFYVSEGGQLAGGRILRISPEGDISVLADSLPGMGDHHTNGVRAGPDGYLYFGQGTATNSGVVGRDNYDYGWLKRYPQFHDIPCDDITLRGQNFETDNVLTEQNGDKALTGAFVPYGQPTQPGQVIPGQIPCSGAIMRLRPEGGNLELVAWGFRNPYGLAFSPGGELFVSENSFDVRGSRPVWGTADYLYRVNPGAWYGWPDYAGGLPLTLETFQVPKEPDPQPVLAKYPGQVPQPVANLGVHSSSNGMDFSRSEAFGYVGQLFIAQFGDMAPQVGKVMSPVGFRVVRVDVDKGEVHEFAANKGKKNGPASWLGSGGLERPLSVRFSPNGEALYVVDFGILRVDKKGSYPEEGTGVVWRVGR